MMAPHCLVFMELQWIKVEPPKIVSALLLLRRKLTALNLQGENGILYSSYKEITFNSYAFEVFDFNGESAENVGLVNCTKASFTLRRL